MAAQLLTPAVTLRDVHQTYGDLELLRGINLKVEPGQVVALFGRSGSGKTTLLNIIGGLERPTRGTVRLEDHDLYALPPYQLDRLRRRYLSFVFQSYGLLSHLSAQENVAFALRLAGFPRTEWAQRAAGALAAVGLARRAHHRPAALSGGERQRVAIARALAIQARLLLADEPTGALDHATGMQMIDLLARYAAERGATVLIGTHDAAVRERVDIVFQLVDGQLVRE